MAAGACTSPEEHVKGGYVAEQVIRLPTPQRENPTMEELLQALKAGGGVTEAPGADKNTAFLELVDAQLPELAIYRLGKIQTSPGVVEIEGSPTEYYRTIGAMIALIACYAAVNGDEFGLETVSKGDRGPMSVDKVPGKFISMGNKPDEYQRFCNNFAEGMLSEDDWWSMLVFLAVHDVGKSDAFRNAVNATLPLAQRSDDHDRALAKALMDIGLKEKLLPSVMRLSSKQQDMIAAGFMTNFQLPQLGQGEIAVINLRGLLEMPKEHLNDGALRNYLYHSIYDIAGASSNENFIYPLALAPVYIGFSAALEDLIARLPQASSLDERSIYFDFLLNGFRKAYPDFDKDVFGQLCESKSFREETGLTLLRVLALTRNTYKNPQKVLEILQGTGSGSEFPSLVQEMSGSSNPPGPQIMLYYAPDMLRMGLGEDLEDASGENMRHALEAIDGLHILARREVASLEAADFQYQLNVQPVVSAIKNAGKSWAGGKQLRDVCIGAHISSNSMKTEGILVLRQDCKDESAKS